MRKNQPAFLIVDDDAAFSQAMGWALEGQGFSVRLAHDIGSAVKSATSAPPDFAIVDLKMPGESGLTLIPALKSMNSAMRILVLTGYASIATAVEAIKLGATHYLAKPVDADDVLKALDKAIGDMSEAARGEGLSAADVEWEHLQKVLASNRGNISASARQLSIDRRTLQRKLARHRLNTG